MNIISALFPSRAVQWKMRDRHRPYCLGEESTDTEEWIWRTWGRSCGGSAWTSRACGAPGCRGRCSSCWPSASPWRPTSSSPAPPATPTTADPTTSLPRLLSLSSPRCLLSASPDGLASTASGGSSSSTSYPIPATRSAMDMKNWFRLTFL